jgi:pilus assembly protein CpaF
MSLELILPFLEPLDVFIRRPDISEIMINGNGSVFIQTGGEMEFVGAGIVREERIQQAVKRMARSIGEEIGPDRPILDVMLSDGSRVAAIFPACSVGGVTLTIRKFRPNWFTLAELIEHGALWPELAAELSNAVMNRATILISGGTGSGKTTLAKALIDCIPSHERLGIIEDTPELDIRHPNFFRFVCRREQWAPDGAITPAVTIRDLVRASLRSRPDRIIIGEVRGGEAFDLLDALNTGQAGSISTVHANSGIHALGRLGSLAMRAGVGIPYTAIQRDIADLIDIVVHCKRMPNGSRRICSVERIQSFDAVAGTFVLQGIAPDK